MVERQQWRFRGVFEQGDHRWYRWERIGVKYPEWTLMDAAKFWPRGQSPNL